MGRRVRGRAIGCRTGVVLAAAVLLAACGTTDAGPATTEGSVDDASLAASSDAATPLPQDSAAVRAPARAPSVTVAAVGDMVCDPESDRWNEGRGTRTECKQKAVSDLVVKRAPDLLLALGDVQYDIGSRSDFREGYAPTYGRLRSKTRPVVGNHEYRTKGAVPYWDYFGALAGPRGKGWYAVTAGKWRIIGLNSNCDQVSCATTGPQVRWLKAELAKNPARCTLVMWHHPRWSNGSEHGDQPQVAPFVRAAYAAGVDVVLAGHDHHYERFAPMRPNGTVDTARGIRTFVVGTGGKNLRSVTKSPTSRARSASSHGALFLTLEPTSYRWEFVPAAGGTFTDRGTGTCH